MIDGKDGEVTLGSAIDCSVTHTYIAKGGIRAAIAESLNAKRSVATMTVSVGPSEIMIDGTSVFARTNLPISWMVAVTSASEYENGVLYGTLPSACRCLAKACPAAGFEALRLVGWVCSSILSRVFMYFW